MPHNPFYSTRIWMDLRAKVIRSRRWCEVCRRLGKRTPGVEVDHIMAIEKGGAPLAQENLRLLCKLHHTQKTRSMDMGAKSSGKALVTYGADGWPIAIEGDHHGYFKKFYEQGSASEKGRHEREANRRKAASFGTGKTLKQRLDSSTEATKDGQPDNRSPGSRTKGDFGGSKDG